MTLSMPSSERSRHRPAPRPRDATDRPPNPSHRNRGAIEAGSSAASNRAAIGWGIVVGVIQAATPLVFWWFDDSTVYALGLAVIAAIYVGFAVSDGRVRIIAVESGVAFAFVLVGAAAVTGTPWLLVAG